MANVIGEAAQALLDDDDIFRLTVSILVDETASRTKRSVQPKIYRSWTPETPMDEDGVGLDSLARLDAAIRLNKFFHLHEVGIEDYLLLEETLGGWCEIIAKSLALKCERVSFRTSGSTGEPEECPHVLADLVAEMKVQAPLYAGTKRIVSLVPPHHIFGFLTTVLLPKLLNCPVVDARSFGPGAWRRDLSAGDLIIATPFLWGTIDRCLDHFPQTICGISSTAPMDNALANKLTAKGLERLTELYGSTQTAGIGYRTDHGDPFSLFSHIERDGDDLCHGGRTLAIQDHMTWETATTFRPTGRKDNAVQVGGVNVFPTAVEKLLTTHSAVKDAAVRLSSDSNGTAREQLVAFVIPADESADIDALSDALTAFCRANLSAVSRPQHFTFGEQIPVNEMGKRAVWA